MIGAFEVTALMLLAGLAIPTGGALARIERFQPKRLEMYWLAPFPKVVGGVMLFAAGGIPYITFQDIAPQAKLKRHWTPALGAVGGYILGLVCQWLVAPELPGM